MLEKTYFKTYLNLFRNILCKYFNTDITTHELIIEILSKMWWKKKLLTEYSSYTKEARNVVIISKQF